MNKDSGNHIQDDGSWVNSLLYISCEEIDAELFSGDFFLGKRGEYYREQLKTYIEGWYRQIRNLEEDQTNYPVFLIEDNFDSLMKEACKVILDCEEDNQFFYAFLDLDCRYNIYEALPETEDIEYLSVFLNTDYQNENKVFRDKEYDVWISAAMHVERYQLANQLMIMKINGD